MLLFFCCCGVCVFGVDGVQFVDCIGQGCVFVEVVVQCYDVFVVGVGCEEGVYVYEVDFLGGGLGVGGEGIEFECGSEGNGCECFGGDFYDSDVSMLVFELNEVCYSCFICLVILLLV